MILRYLKILTMQKYIKFNLAKRGKGNDVMIKNAKDLLDETSPEETAESTNENGSMLSENSQRPATLKKTAKFVVAALVCLIVAACTLLMMFFSLPLLK